MKPAGMYPQAINNIPETLSSSLQYLAPPTVCPSGNPIFDSNLIGYSSPSQAGYLTQGAVTKCDGLNFQYNHQLYPQFFTEPFVASLSRNFSNTLENNVTYKEPLIKKDKGDFSPQLCDCINVPIKTSQIKKPMKVFRIYKEIPSFQPRKVAFTKTGNTIKEIGSENQTAIKAQISKTKFETHKYRNVYKSIIRAMFNYTTQQKEQIRSILKNKGYNDVKIRTAFETIRQYKTSDNPKSIEKKSQYRIQQILKNKSIITIILKETLINLLDDWSKGDYGKISKMNITLYIETCRELLNEVRGIFHN